MSVLTQAVPGNISSSTPSYGSPASSASFGSPLQAMLNPHIIERVIDEDAWSKSVRQLHETKLQIEKQRIHRQHKQQQKRLAQQQQSSMNGGSSSTVIDNENARSCWPTNSQESKVSATGDGATLPLGSLGPAGPCQASSKIVGQDDTAMDWLHHEHDKEKSIAQMAHNLDEKGMIIHSHGPSQANGQSNTHSKPSKRQNKHLERQLQLQRLFESKLEEYVTPSVQRWVLDRHYYHTKGDGTEIVTFFDGGCATIPEHDYAEFLHMVAKQYEYGGHNSKINELYDPQRLRFFLDWDLKLSNNRDLGMEFLKPRIEVVQQVMREFFPHGMHKVIVSYAKQLNKVQPSTKGKGEYPNGYYKHGLHLNFPEVVVTMIHAKLLAQTIADRLEYRLSGHQTDQLTLNPITDQIDLKVYRTRGGGLRMIYQSKMEDCGHCPGNSIPSSSGGQTGQGPSQASQTGQATAVQQMTSQGLSQSSQSSQVGQPGQGPSQAKQHKVCLECLNSGKLEVGRVYQPIAVFNEDASPNVAMLQRCQTNVHEAVRLTSVRASKLCPLRLDFTEPLMDETKIRPVKADLAQMTTCLVQLSATPMRPNLVISPGVVQENYYERAKTQSAWPVQDMIALTLDGMGSTIGATSSPSTSLAVPSTTPPEAPGVASEALRANPLLITSPLLVTSPLQLFALTNQLLRLHYVELTSNMSSYEERQRKRQDQLVRQIGPELGRSALVQDKDGEEMRDLLQNLDRNSTELKKVFLSEADEVDLESFLQHKHEQWQTLRLARSFMYIREGNRSVVVCTAPRNHAARYCLNKGAMHGSSKVWFSINMRGKVYQRCNCKKEVVRISGETCHDCRIPLGVLPEHLLTSLGLGIPDMVPNEGIAQLAQMSDTDLAMSGMKAPNQVQIIRIDIEDSSSQSQKGMSQSSSQQSLSQQSLSQGSSQSSQGSNNPLLVQKEYLSAAQLARLPAQIQLSDEEKIQISRQYVERVEQWKTNQRLFGRHKILGWSKQLEAYRQEALIQVVNALCNKRNGTDQMQEVRDSSSEDDDDDDEEDAEEEGSGDESRSRSRRSHAKSVQTLLSDKPTPMDTSDLDMLADPVSSFLSANKSSRRRGVGQGKGAAQAGLGNIVGKGAPRSYAKRSKKRRLDADSSSEDDYV